ncbi:MAG: biotin--[acetyl-CoA-carboxylase] ligase [Nitrospiraceae bacterium]|nr:biotin--[acetyl-CoA-carboxylase] ligase [Nitrospiraceae bacterium]
MKLTIKSFEKLDSTQKAAKKLKRPSPWTAILAEEQTLGYGRKRDFWYSPKGGLYFSIVLPRSKIEDIQVLTILSAFSVAKLLKNDFNLQTFIKYPNDVYLKGKKICGIITENKVSAAGRILFSVMGIGLNTNIDKFPKNLENKTTSLKIELGREVDNERLMKKIIRELRKQIK